MASGDKNVYGTQIIHFWLNIIFSLQNGKLTEIFSKFDGVIESLQTQWHSRHVEF